MLAIGMRRGSQRPPSDIKPECETTSGYNRVEHIFSKSALPAEGDRERSEKEISITALAQFKNGQKEKGYDRQCQCKWQDEESYIQLKEHVSGGTYT